MQAVLAMMPETQPERPLATRMSERFEVQARVSSRRLGRQACRVRVYDLSRHGCKVDFADRPALDELLWIKFTGLESLEAMVCWVDGFKVGLEFSKAIHPSVFDLLLKRLGEPSTDW